MRLPVYRGKDAIEKATSFKVASGIRNNNVL